MRAIDFFCGCGGSTTGLKAAGFEVIHAANHWQLAIDSHATNHPNVEHSCCDLNLEHPARFPKAEFAWFSPECTTFSPSGGRGLKSEAQLKLWEMNGPDPSVERSRMTAWDVIRHAEWQNFMGGVVENVVEFCQWQLFDVWLLALKELGYETEIISFNSQFAGVPQSRDRVYIAFWKKGKRKPDFNIRPAGTCVECGPVKARQAWKLRRGVKAKAGKYGAQYFYSCPNCLREVVPNRVGVGTVLDLSRPAPKIGGRQRPLSANTKARIEKGLKRFFQPFVTISRKDGGCHPLSDPIATVTTSRHHGLVVPFLTSYYGNGGEALISDPAPTMRTKQGHALIEPDWSLVVDECGYRMVGADEVIRIMGFEASYKVLGGKTDQFKQAGAAVTPPVAELIGRSLLDWGMAA